MILNKQNNKFSTIIIVILILMLGIACALFFIWTKPVTKRVKPAMATTLVSTMSAKREMASLMVEALGTVNPAQETNIKMRVTGQVEELGESFDVGGLLAKDALLLRIDQNDYKNSLAMKDANLAKAKADYDLEMGQQRVARTELAQLSKRAPNSVKNTSLALRVPQLAMAKANLQFVEVEHKQATLDLSRTIVTSPYNALVIQRNVSLGSQASPSDIVAVLVGTDTYYIEAAIPLDKLKDLGLSTFNDTKAQIYTSTGAMREGLVKHSIANLDDITRMGRVLVEVQDPLALQNDLPELILGDHVRVMLKAGILPNVIKLPRGTLRGNDSIWLAKKGPQGKLSLDIRKVEVVWKDLQFVYIGKGLEDGEQVITSPIGAPIQDMLLRLVKPKGQNNE